MEWTRTAATAFIDLLKSHPCLWKVKCPTYKNKDIKNSAYEKMKRDLSVLGYTVTQDEIRKKINTLRAQYRKERNQVIRSRRTGSGTEDIYVPKLWCYTLLSFLDEGDVCRDSANTLDEVSAP